VIYRLCSINLSHRKRFRRSYKLFALVDDFLCEVSLQSFTLSSRDSTASRSRFISIKTGRRNTLTRGTQLLAGQSLYSLAILFWTVSQTDALRRRVLLGASQKDRANAVHRRQLELRENDLIEKRKCYNKEKSATKWL